MNELNKLSKIDLKNCFVNSLNKKNHNKKLFGFISKKYNFATKILSLNQDSKWKLEFIKLLPTFDKPNCLDLACGTGDITFKLAQKYPEGKIFAIDLTQEMIDQAIQLNRFSNIEFICKDMAQTDFPNDCFDLITGSYAFRNASDLNKALVEAHRVLKPNGTLAILDFSKFNNKFLQTLQLFILQTWGNLCGLLLHSNMTTYGYIAQSIKHFPSKNEFKEILEKTGFEIQNVKSFYFGIIQIHILKKM